MPRACPRNSCHNACCAFRKQHRDRRNLELARNSARAAPDPPRRPIQLDAKTSGTPTRPHTKRPIEGAAGIAKKRELRELKQRIFNLQDQLTTLEHQFAQDSTAQLKPAEAKIVQIKTAEIPQTRRIRAESEA